MDPGDVYQSTKAEADRLALDYHRARGVPVTVVRPGAIYGPGDRRLLKIFRAIARGRYVQIGSGRPCYHPVYIATS
jgi:nucleoside-diphosphate-sugar epimerase